MMSNRLSRGGDGSARARAVRSTGAVGSRRTSILLADDHEVMRCGVRTIIESRPDWHLAGEASDGQSAWKLAQRLSPDIVIADYLLPGLNGLDLTARIVRDLPKTHVLIYTMQDREDLALKVIHAGARGYVLKSDGSKSLVDAIEALAEGEPYFTTVVAEALLDHLQSPAKMVTPAGLTDRELEVVRLVAEGHTNRQISAILGTSLKTAEAHRLSAMEKLNFTRVVLLPPKDLTEPRGLSDR